MKILVTSLALLLFVTNAEAAKFESIKKFSNENLEALAKVAFKMTHDESTFGNATKVFSFSIEGNKDDQKTAGQLNHMKGDINSDDTSAVDYKKKSAGDLADVLMAPTNDGNEKIQKMRDQLAEALKDLKKDRGIKFFGASHADEDGTWEILDVIDTKNDEVLFIRSGGFGT